MDTATNKRYGDVLIEIGNLLNDYEESQKLTSAKEQAEKLYSINEIQEIYPQLSTHLITKAINEGLLSVTRIGRLRYFYLKDIEEYLQSITTQTNIAEELNAWRNRE